LAADHFFGNPRPPVGRLARRLSAFAAGAALPVIGMLFWLKACGVFDRFWFWTMDYAMNYATRMSLSNGLDTLKDMHPELVDGYFLVWIMAGVGAFVPQFLSNRKSAKVFLPLFAVFSFLSVCPGFYFRNHYFVMFLPALSLNVGVCAEL